MLISSTRRARLASVALAIAVTLSLSAPASAQAATNAGPSVSTATTDTAAVGKSAQAATDAGPSASTATADATVASGTSAQAAADTDPSPNIIGGTDATESYPFQVRVLTYYPELGATGRCSGTLVTIPVPRAKPITEVALNAHCVSDFTTAQAVPAGNVTVQYGSTHLDQLQSFTAPRVEVHPDWDWLTGTNRAADAAVIAVPPSLHLTGIPIGQWAGVDRDVRLLGWGKTTIDATQPPSILQQLDTSITDPQACAAAEGGVTAGEICIAPARNGGQACFGDSGGGALAHVGSQRWVLLGGASRETHEDCTGATVYTNFTYYRAWLTRVLIIGQPHHPRRVASDAALRYAASLLAQP